MTTTQERTSPGSTRGSLSLAAHVPDIEAAILEPILAEIDELKRQRNAVVLAHNYMTPDIFYGVADLRGDSLQLARLASETPAEVIVMAGVHFMAETAKILSPEKTVLIPDTRAGCSLAESITPADITVLREQYPGAPVVTYVNTSAAVKAASDITCTSSNAVAIVESLDADRVIFTPDQYLGAWVAGQTDKEIIVWQGACEVHERFTGAQLVALRVDNPGLKIIAHPECPPDVLAEADYVGSTSGMSKWIEIEQPARVAMITECSMADNVAELSPDTDFVRPCNMCPHMKRITVQNIRTALENMEHVVEVSESDAAGARRALEAMLAAS